MRICLNMVSNSNWGGGVLYIQNLIHAILSLDSNTLSNIKISLAIKQSQLYLSKPFLDSLDSLISRNSAQNFKHIISKLLSDRIHFNSSPLLSPVMFDFVYPEFSLNKLPYHWAGWIPDFQHRYFPELFSPLEILRRNFKYSKLANIAPKVALSSDAARKDFVDFYPHARERSFVLPFTSYADPKWFEANPKLPLDKYQIPEKYFLMCNQFWKHKDHMVVIKALDILRHSSELPVVVCTGSITDYRFPNYFSELMNKVIHLKLDCHFIVLGLIPRIDQIQLMRSCIAVIQPSLFEGWSTVIEDARIIGKPVIASNFPVHLEQNHPKASYFSCGDAPQLANLMATFYQNLHFGVNSQSEELGRQENQLNLQIFGRKFLAIANSI